MKIVLLPIPEYPISSQEKKDAEESAQEPDSTLYKEDGSLEVPNCIYTHQMWFD